MEKIAQRATPEEPAAKRMRPLSVEVCSDGDEGSEVRATALFVAEPTGALGILVAVPVADLVEARKTPRAPESVETSEEVLPRESPSRPRSVEPSPSPTADVRTAGELAPASDVSVASRSREIAGGVPSEAAMQNGVRQLLALFEAAGQLGAPVGRRESEHLEDAPRDRRGRLVHEEFVPASRPPVQRPACALCVWAGLRGANFVCVRARYTYVWGVCEGVLVWTLRAIRVPLRCRC